MTSEEIAADMDRQADELAAWLRRQSDAYLQIEDQGHTSARIRELRAQAERIRDAVRR